MQVENYTNYENIPKGIGYKHSNIHDVDLFKEMGSVKRVPLFAEVWTKNSGLLEKLESYKGLINTKSNEILDCRPISKTYHLVNHDELFLKQADILRNNSDLPSNNVTVLDRVYENGRRASRSIHFNDLKMDVGKNDPVTCRLDVFNSVDMSWAFQVFSGAYRDLCRNTQVFGGEKAYQQKHLHTSKLDTTALLNNAQTSLRAWNDNRDKMMQWKNKSISDTKFARFLSDTLCKVEHGRGIKLVAEQEHKVNQKLLNFLTHVFQKESVDCGSNLWSGYNALTYWSTHTDVEHEGRTMGSSEAKHTVQVKRQQKVRELLQSSQWQDLECVA